MFIPNSKVFGNWQYFVNQYDPWIPEDTKRILARIQELTDACENDDYKSILEKHYIYVNDSPVDGTYKFPRLDDVKQLLKDRLNDLINGPKVTMEDLPKEEGRPLYCPFKPVYAEESGK